MQLMDDPPGSRLFVVCGKTVEADVLYAAFKPYGSVQNLKVIRDKGVAYVKFDKASSAACAMETLNGAVLNNGRGPKLKVLLAEAPSSRGLGGLREPSDQELSSDPDNVPPRSRLFIVVPKTAEPWLIQEELSHFEGLTYCKTDLITSKGVVFCKYSKASSALRALEHMLGKGMLAGYKVKAMLAEPKTKRARPDSSYQQVFSAMPQVTKLEYCTNGNAVAPGYGAFAFGSDTRSPDVLTPPPVGLAEYSTMGALTGVNGGITGFHGAHGMGGLVPGGDDLGQQVRFGFMGAIGSVEPTGSTGLTVSHHQHPDDVHLWPDRGDAGMAMASLANSMSFSNSSGNGSLNSGASALSTGTYTATYPYTGAVSPLLSPKRTSSPLLSRQRLFVVVHKGVSEDIIARLFRRFPGMEYCDLKKDRTSGKSKGYCYVNYSTAEAASAAVEQFNGIEFPPGSGHRIKVMYAEPLGVRVAGAPGAGGGGSANAAAPGGGGGVQPHPHPALGLLPGSAHSSGDGSSSFHGSSVTSNDVAVVQDSFANMSLPLGHEVPHHGELPLLDLDGHGQRMASPPVGAVARELMFNVG